MAIRLLTGLLGVCLLLVCSLAVGQETLDPTRMDSAERARLALERPGIVLRTPRLNVAGSDAQLAGRIAGMVEEAVAVLPPELVDVELRIRVEMKPPVEGVCPTRAFASAREGYGFVNVFVDPAWSDAMLRRIVAHEVGHVYHFALRGAIEGPSGDAILIEGLATWLARHAWLADLGFASFDDAVRSYLEDGTYVSLAGDYELDVVAAVSSPAECFALRDRLYTQWAGFVAFLLDEYGLDAVLASAEQAREVLESRDDGMWLLAPLDYQAAFGAALEDLESRWLAGVVGP